MNVIAYVRSAAMRLAIIGSAALAIISGIHQACFGQTVHETAARIDRNIDPGWKFIRRDIQGAQDTTFDDASWKSVDLPYTWPVEENDDRATYYAGPAWYRTHLSVGPELSGKNLYLRFGAASRLADVYINGKLAGEHKGAFGAFCFEITQLAHPGDNVVAVRVDNSKQLNISPISGDFTVYGGLFREVHLLALNPVSITPLDDAGPGVYLKTKVDENVAEVEVTTKLQNTGDATARVVVICTVTNAEGKQVQQCSTRQSVPANGTADAVGQLNIEHPHLWSGRNDPYLYQAKIEVRQDDSILDRLVQPLGLRFFSVDDVQGLSLNGKHYDLHGVNYHEGRTSVGFADTPAMEEEDNKLICEMGCTGVRMAHYQHNDYEYTLADKSGLVVWTELALVNRMVNTPDFKENVKQQLRELIKQNYNHPSVFFWSMYNEPWVGRDKNATQDSWKLIQECVKLAHDLDPTRLTTGAAVDGAGGPILWYMDITGMNRYAGWYGGSYEKWPQETEGLHVLGHKVGISEYGGGASIFQHETHSTTRPTPGGKWHPEEWQALIHEHAWPAIQNKDWMWCKFVWCMFDFSSSSRHEGDHTGINDKGLVTADHKTRKDAFYYYKANWTTEPMVYITDRRFNPRPPGPADLKVYSNCPTITLTINGNSLGSQTQPSHVFIWRNVTLSNGDVTASATGFSNGKAVSDLIKWNVRNMAATAPLP